MLHLHCDPALEPGMVAAAVAVVAVVLLLLYAHHARLWVVQVAAQKTALGLTSQWTPQQAGVSLLPALLLATPMHCSEKLAHQIVLEAVVVVEAVV